MPSPVLFGKAGAGQAMQPAPANEGLVITELANLPSATLLDETALSRCVGVHPRTLRRIIARGQLPAGVKLGARRMWVAGKVAEFITTAAELQATNARKLALRLGQGGN